MKRNVLHINPNPNRPYRVEDIETSVTQLQPAMRYMKMSNTEAAYVTVLNYAYDLISRATPKAPLLLEEDEAFSMYKAAFKAFVGNYMGCGFPFAVAKETARKMLGSYLMLWAWNYYLERREEGGYSMKTHLETGKDPDSGNMGITKLQIILTDDYDRSVKYVFDASAIAAECFDTLFKIRMVNNEKTGGATVQIVEDDTDIRQLFFDHFPCGFTMKPDFCIPRIMDALYAPFEGRFDAWYASYPGYDALKTQHLDTDEEESAESSDPAEPEQPSDVDTAQPEPDDDLDERLGEMLLLVAPYFDDEEEDEAEEDAEAEI